MMDSKDDLTNDNESGYMVSSSSQYGLSVPGGAVSVPASPRTQFAQSHAAFTKVPTTIVRDVFEEVEKGLDRSTIQFNSIQFNSFQSIHY